MCEGVTMKQKPKTQEALAALGFWVRFSSCDPAIFPSLGSEGGPLYPQHKFHHLRKLDKLFYRLQCVRL